MVKRIITHDGIFHPDEVFAIALVHEFYGVVGFTRDRFVHFKEFNDPTVMVLDQGLKYEPQKLNFDHHQDKKLPATVMLVLNELFKQSLMTKEHYDILFSPILTISEIDVHGPDGYNGFQVSEFIRSLNSNTQDESKNFAVAVSIARTYVRSKIEMVNTEMPKSHSLWAKGEVIDHLIRVCEGYPSFWKDYKEQPILVYSHAGLWKLQVADVGEYPIKATGKEVYLHSELWMAHYRTKTEAIDAARKTKGFSSLTA